MAECIFCRARATHAIVVRPLELPPHRPIKGQGAFRRLLCANCAERVRQSLKEREWVER